MLNVDVLAKGDEKRAIVPRREIGTLYVVRQWVGANLASFRDWLRDGETDVEVFVSNADDEPVLYMRFPRAETFDGLRVVRDGEVIERTQLRAMQRDAAKPAATTDHPAPAGDLSTQTEGTTT